MPTSWTKTNNVTTSYTKTADISTSYTEEADKTTIWPSFFGLIRLVTEGLREFIMTEGDTDHIVVSHGEDVEIWTDEADKSTTYTKVNDI